MSISLGSIETTVMFSHIQYIIIHSIITAHQTKRKYASLSSTYLSTTTVDV
jgi:hypothetical protein